MYLPRVFSRENQRLTQTNVVRDESSSPLGRTLSHFERVLVAGLQTPNAIELRDRSNDCNDIVTLCNVWYACIVPLKAFAFEWMDVENWRVECNFDLALVSAFPKVSRRRLRPSLKIWCSSEVWDNAACLWYLKMLMMIYIIKGTYY